MPSFVTVPAEAAVSSEPYESAGEYRKKAAEARQKARTLLSESAREAMLRAAEIWEDLAARAERKNDPR